MFALQNYRMQLTKCQNFKSNQDQLQIFSCITLPSYSVLEIQGLLLKTLLLEGQSEENIEKVFDKY